MSDDNKVLAWHFIRDDMTIVTDSTVHPIHVVPGQVLRYRGEIKLCHRGLHASEVAMDALQYAPGAVVCRVECSDRIARQQDKLACGRRHVLWMADATRTLHEFAIWAGEEALKLIDNPDPRSVRALIVKRAWLNGKASDDELAAAWDAARSAAWAAAWDAARSAAWDAARSAAWSAAWAAARVAAWDAARVAAWDAARSAAWAAARSAAWAAARDAQNAELERRLMLLGDDNA